MDKMREEFEAWCCKRGYTLKPAETNCGIIIEGAYGHPRVQLAWESWQESRAALRVELPKTPGFSASDEPDLAYEEGIDDMKDILESMGVTCK